MFRPLPHGTRFWHPAMLLATWGGVGLIRFAPGTAGSLAAIPFAWAVSAAGGVSALALATLAVFAVGVWASAYVGRSGETDSGTIVIDEVAGQWIALLPVIASPPLWPLAFGLFRVLDIVKPWPANWVDRTMHSAVGVMLDDVIAGLYAGAILWAGIEIWQYLG